jgi:hypothetical protein
MKINPKNDYKKVVTLLRPIEERSLEELADPDINHSTDVLIAWGYALFDRNELEIFDRLLDSESLTPYEIPGWSYSLQCVLNYSHFRDESKTLAAKIDSRIHTNDVYYRNFLTNLAKAFALASAQIAPLNPDLE